MSGKHNTPKSISNKKRRFKETGLLSDMTRESFFKKIRKLEERDRITYKKPYPYYYSPPKHYPRSIISKPSEDSLRDSSSEESIEYEVINSYEVGSLGLVPFGKEIGSKKYQAIKSPRSLNLESRQLNFDLVTARILSDLGLLNKFEKIDNTLVLRKRPVKKKRQYYPF
ncbi:hypothetical protein HNY73_008296 [Argiope bruennichi]|uniref:Uncharacterized protein n=1 Tax=Argiope bruennichi TaxID=94029 RepID=A0A8T0F894_ARGBR|nr:hypothetical protein HNY73_008296 [Argiope bruennichi]